MVSDEVVVSLNNLSFVSVCKGKYCLNSHLLLLYLVYSVYLDFHLQ